jgi:hypothetical protein
MHIVCTHEETKMTDLAVANIAAASMTAGEGATAQPTAQQVARFEQQLQAPGAGEAQYYQAPAVEAAAAGSGGNWQGVMNNVGQLAEQYRLDSVSLDAGPVSVESSSGAPAVEKAASPAEFFQQGMTRLSHMSYTMMTVSVVTSTERMAGENVRSLFQLS